MPHRPAPRAALPLVRLRNASVTRSGHRLARGLDFDLMPGARWAVLGENGAGKTTLLRLVRGDVPPDPGGLREYALPGPAGEEPAPQPSPLGLRQRLALVSADMQDLYAVHGWAATGLEVVLAGFADTALLYGPALPEHRARAEALLSELGLAALADRRMAGLSTGEGRKILLARALAVEPDALLLDECLEGLDAASRREFLALIDRAAAHRPGLALLFTSHRAGAAGELPACLDSALVLDSGRIVKTGPLAALPADTPSPARPAARAAAPAENPSAPASGPAILGGFLARIAGADVDIGGERILSAIHWTIRPGEHWAVLGPNGAGKSTLLALLAGEHWPSAVSGPPGVVEYGFAPAGKDGGETFDEARRRIGVVSAALQAGYSWDLTALDVVCSGADGSMGLYAEPEPAARARAGELLEMFGMADLAGRRIRSLSRGQLRRVLLARALMDRPVLDRTGLDRGGRAPSAPLPPSLLLLDEPMAGLDACARRGFRQMLDRVAHRGRTALVLVTHHLSDLPACVNRVLELRSGRVAYAGDLPGHEKWKAARRMTGRSSENLRQGRG